MSEWKKFDHEDRASYPMEAGTYAVMIASDSERSVRDGAHVFYEFDDYQTFANFGPDEDGGQFKGFHDEEHETVMAWFGPIVIPPCDCLQ